MKKLIFDFDGTLCNSSERHVLVLNDCLSKAGYLDININDYLAFKAEGYSTLVYLKQVLGLNDEISRKVARDWVENIEKEEYLKKDTLYHDAVPTLDECIAQGFQLYLVSARRFESNLIQQIEHMGIDSYFCEICCVSPDKAAAEKAKQIKRIGADLIIGDTEADWKAAIEVNIPYYILNRGFRNQYFWYNKNVQSYDSLLYLGNFILDLR